MNHIFYIMGKSSSGKDTVYKSILKELDLRPVILYTTRPMRENEAEGREYHFVDRKRFLRMKLDGSVIEERHYDTVHGEWIYFTAKESIDLSRNCLGIGTIESFVQLREHFGDEVVVPVYIEVDDGIRLQRALDREKTQTEPKYAEMCRRFLADTADFSEDKIAKADIRRRFFNNDTIEECIAEVREFISGIVK